ELRAFTLAESAASVALNPEDWGNAERWRGQMLEYIGLPGDASTTYDGILRRRADDGDARLRMMWLLVHLRDPQAPDRIQLNPNAGGGRGALSRGRPPPVGCACERWCTASPRRSTASGCRHRRGAIPS